MLDNILLSLSSLIRQGGAGLPIIAFLGGFLTSLTPCSLSSLPFIIAYLSRGEEIGQKEAFKLSLTYALGNALTFSVFGITAAIIGRMFSFSSKLIYIVLGLLMLVMALQQFEVIDIFKSFHKQGRKVKRNKFSAFALGVVSGVFASPCATPVMIALMAMISSSKSSILWGAFLFVLYALGHGITTVFVGTATEKAKITKTKSYEKFSIILKYAFGIFMLAIGLLLLYQGF